MLARVLVWVRRAFCLAVLLFLITFGLIARSAARRLDRELLHRRTIGELVSIEELVPHAPSQTQNAAEGYLRAHRGVLRLSQEQWTLLFGADGYLWSASTKPPTEWSPTERALAQAAVEANSDYFRVLEEASCLRQCAFPVAWHRGHMTSLLHLPALIAEGLMLRARAFFLAQQSRGDEALSTCATLLRIADHVEREPALQSQHHGYRLQALALDGIEYALRSGAVGEAACRRLSQQLAGVDLVSRSIKALQGEEAIYGLPTFDSARRMLPWELRPPTAARPRVAHLAPRYALALDELAYLDYAKQAITALRLPWPTAARAARDADARVAQLSDSRGLLTKWVAPDLLPELQHRQETMARMGAAQIALAVTAYRLRTGRYPVSLAHLQRTTGKLPTDPFSGQPYRYHPSAPDLVYSVGPDMLDDGGLAPTGAAAPDLEQHRWPDLRQHYDVVFGSPLRSGGGAGLQPGSVSFTPLRRDDIIPRRATAE